MSAQVSVITVNQIEGFHCWPDAPEEVRYLADRHRHVFTVECEFSVSHTNRAVEIITRQHEVERFFARTYGTPAEFSHLSCEMIAQAILAEYPDCVCCMVREDGFGGARVVRG